MPADLADVPVRDPSPSADAPSIKITAMEDRRPQADARTPEPVIELRGLSLYYGGFRAVRDVDLSFAKQRIEDLNP